MPEIKATLRLKYSAGGGYEARMTFLGLAISGPDIGGEEEGKEGGTREEGWIDGTRVAWE